MISGDSAAVLDCQKEVSFAFLEETGLSEGAGIVEVDGGLVRVMTKGDGHHLLHVTQSPCYRHNSSTIKEVTTEKLMSTVISAWSIMILIVDNMSNLPLNKLGEGDVN